MNSKSGLLADMSPRVWQMAGMELWQGAIWLKMIAQQTVSKTFEYSQIWGIGFWGMALEKMVQFSIQKQNKLSLYTHQIHTEHYPSTTRAKSHDIGFSFATLCKPENIYRFNMPSGIFPHKLWGGSRPWKNSPPTALRRLPASAGFSLHVLHALLSPPAMDGQLTFRGVKKPYIKMQTSISMCICVKKKIYIYIYIYVLCTLHIFFVHRLIYVCRDMW